VGLLQMQIARYIAGLSDAAVAGTLNSVDRRVAGHFLDGFKGL
jgi:hypothetical protein